MLKRDLLSQHLYKYSTRGMAPNRSQTQSKIFPPLFGTPFFTGSILPEVQKSPAVFLPSRQEDWTVAETQWQLKHCTVASCVSLSNSDSGSVIICTDPNSSIHKQKSKNKLDTEEKSRIRIQIQCSGSGSETIRHGIGILLSNQQFLKLSINF